MSIRQISREAIADGAEVISVKELPRHEGITVRAGLNEFAHTPRKYDLFSWNCETFAEWLTSGVPKSEQVAGAVLLLIVVFGLAVAARF
jgi:hypothetical protein